jgi:hypothetical protein
MSRDYTGSGRSAANLNNYNKIVYFVGGVMVRNATLDIEETDWSLAAQRSKWTQYQWSNFSFVYKACGDLRPNADIAGIVVVLAFMVFSFTTGLVLSRTDSMFQITALITIIACLFRGLYPAIIAISKDECRHELL